MSQWRYVHIEELSVLTMSHHSFSGADASVAAIDSDPTHTYLAVAFDHKMTGASWHEEHIWYRRLSPIICVYVATIQPYLSATLV
jgi:hypothetical protein